MEVCRCCSGEDGAFQSLFEGENSFKMREMLVQVTGLQIEESIELPKKICKKCVDILCEAYRFRILCIQTDAAFRTKSENEFEVDMKYNLQNHNELPTKSEMDHVILGENIIAKRHKKGFYVCNYCGYSRSSKKLLIKHISSHENSVILSKLVCEICRKRFAHQSSLCAHKKLHDGIKPYCCDLCGKGLSSKDTLAAHKRLHTDERPFRCPTCGKCFRSMGNLRAHRKIHVGHKPHACSVCNKAFFTSSGMKAHTRRHKKELPFSCPLCSKRFTAKFNYEMHLKIHAGKKDFECDHCGSTFISKDALRRHMFVHSGKHRFKCRDCPKSFSGRSALITHRAVHGQIRKYVCEICNQSFNFSSGLSRHRRLKHKVTPKPISKDII